MNNLLGDLSSTELSALTFQTPVHIEVDIICDISCRNMVQLLLHLCMGPIKFSTALTQVALLL